MRRAIVIVLSAILVTTPIKVVLAQADQRESQVAAADSTRIQTPTRIGVPVVEPGSGAALLFTAGMRDHILARNALPPSRQISTADKVARITDKVVLIGAGLFVGLMLSLVTACGSGCFGTGGMGRLNFGG